MPYGLSREIVKKINQVFSNYDQVEEAVLYGSRAKGTFKKGSDIDLTLKGHGLNLKLINRIGMDLDNLMLPYTFDISIYSHIKNKELLDHIDRVGKGFYIQVSGSKGD